MGEFENGHFINVSLAGFDMPGNGEPAKSQEVELSILQQILYKKNRDALPDSRIDRILNRNKEHIRHVFVASLKILLPLGGAFFLMFHDTAHRLTGVPEGLYDFINELPYVRMVVLAILFLILLYFITECASRVGIFDKKIKLNKVGLLSGELDLQSGDTSSLLNNCLDEIVYFFSKLTEYRIVIFEDLDRLKNPEIFVKLREINKIVNNNLSEEAPLRFIYAVRDDIFSGADTRTKFFDFIIPIVPVMDSRNAFSLLNDKMKFYIQDGEDCLRSTAAYISDMRSLKNIVNEYLLFSEVVDNTKSKINLYALVFYKNIFGHDYSFIDRKISILYRFIHDYRIMKLHKEYFSELDERFSSLSSHLAAIIAEKSRTSEDVRKNIISTFIPYRLTGVISFYTTQNNHHHSPYNTQQLIDNEEYFVELLKSTSTIKLGVWSYNSDATITLSSSERNAVFEDYQTRKTIVGEKREETFKSVQREIKQVKEDIRRKNAISLAELVTLMKKDAFTEVARKYMDDIRTHDFISEEQFDVIRSEMRYGGFDALYLLLSRGYLDQDFMRSRSVFHEGGLSVNDNEFVKNVALGLSSEKSNTEFAIDDVAGVLREITAQHLLHHDAVLHHQIIAHLLSSSASLLDEMFATLFSKSGEYVLNIFSILDSRFADPDTFPCLLVRALDKNGYLDAMVTLLKTGEDSESHTCIAAAVVSWISPDRTETPDQYRQFVGALGTGIVHFVEPARVPTFMTYIAELEVCYETLTVPLSDTEQDCVCFIGKNHLYRLTSENVGITLATQLLAEGISVEECRKRPWTLAQTHSLPALDYFSDNADEFVREVFLSSEEQGRAVTDVLSLDPLSDAMKFRIVEEMNFCLDTLAEISTEPGRTEAAQQLSFHDLFYRHDRIQAEWPELTSYIGEDCNMQVLTGFMTRHADTLSLSGPESKDGDLYDLLYMKVICNTGFNNDDYKKVVKYVEINTSHFDERISNEIIIRLLEMNKIPLTPEDYTHVIGNASEPDSAFFNVLVSWFSRYQDVFMAASDHYLYKEDDEDIFGVLLDGVMCSALFTDDNKITLFSQNEDYYREMNAADIKLPVNTITRAFSAASGEDLKLQLIISLVAGGYQDRGRLALMTETMEEKELQKIFTQKYTATLTLNDRDNCISLLDWLKQSGLIKSYEFRDDGKVSVVIGNPASDASE